MFTGMLIVAGVLLVYAAYSDLRNRRRRRAMSGTREHPKSVEQVTREADVQMKGRFNEPPNFPGNTPF